MMNQTRHHEVRAVSGRAPQDDGERFGARRKKMMRVLALLVAAVLGLAPAQVQQYPDRVIKLVVPFVPGSPVDVLARVVSQQMTTRLGQSVVIENRPGAG